MVFEKRNFDTTRNLGINYIPCYQIVLMFDNALAMSSGGLITQNFKLSTNEYRKHRTSGQQ